MFAHTFRFDQVNARMRNVFSTPRKPRHRALRVVLVAAQIEHLAHHLRVIDFAYERSDLNGHQSHGPPRSTFLPGDGHSLRQRRL